MPFQTSSDWISGAGARSIAERKYLVWQQGPYCPEILYRFRFRYALSSKENVTPRHAEADDCRAAAQGDLRKSYADLEKKVEEGALLGVACSYGTLKATFASAVGDALGRLTKSARRRHACGISLDAMVGARSARHR